MTVASQQCWVLAYHDNELGQTVHLGLAYSAAEVTAFQFRCLRHGDTPMVKPYSSFVRDGR